MSRHDVNIDDHSNWNEFTYKTEGKYSKIRSRQPFPLEYFSNDQPLPFTTSPRVMRRIKDQIKRIAHFFANVIGTSQLQLFCIQILKQNYHDPNVMVNSYKRALKKKWLSHFVMRGNKNDYHTMLLLLILIPGEQMKAQLAELESFQHQYLAFQSIPVQIRNRFTRIVRQRISMNRQWINKELKSIQTNSSRIEKLSSLQPRLDFYMLNERRFQFDLQERLKSLDNVSNPSEREREIKHFQEWKTREEQELRDQEAKKQALIEEMTELEELKIHLPYQVKRFQVQQARRLFENRLLRSVLAQPIEMKRLFEEASIELGLESDTPLSIMNQESAKRLTDTMMDILMEREILRLEQQEQRQLEAVKKQYEEQVFEEDWEKEVRRVEQIITREEKKREQDWKAAQGIMEESKQDKEKRDEFEFEQGRQVTDEEWKRHKHVKELAIRRYEEIMDPPFSGQRVYLDEWTRSREEAIQDELLNTRRQLEATMEQEAHAFQGFTESQRQLFKRQQLEEIDRRMNTIEQGIRLQIAGDAFSEIEVNVEEDEAF